MTITQEQFDSLLSWLGNNPDLAGRKYETIRSGLVRVFISKGFNDAEDLADETINRVIARLPDIRANYTGEPARYFHGVARNVIRERGRRREIADSLIEGRVEPEFERSEEHDCLGHCLDRLPVSKRDLILNYYLYEGHRKIEHHKQMAGQLKITEGAIRSRAYQIRANLENCMRQCQCSSRGSADSLGLRRSARHTSHAITGPTPGENNHGDINVPHRQFAASAVSRELK